MSWLCQCGLQRRMLQRRMQQYNGDPSMTKYKRMHAQASSDLLPHHRRRFGRHAYVMPPLAPAITLQLARSCFMERVVDIIANAEQL